MSTFHPVAVPLLVNDPYFSIWSFSEKLTDDTTRHWTGHVQSLLGTLTVDGRTYRFLGNNISREYGENVPAMKQKSLKILPTNTIYTFECPEAILKVTFMSALLPDHLEILSRPVSYMFYEIQPKEDGHQFSVYVEASAEIAGDCEAQNHYIVTLNPGDAKVGTAEQRVLGKCGDNVRIDWGYFHMVHENVTAQRAYYSCSNQQKRNKMGSKPLDPAMNYLSTEKAIPVLCTTSEKLEDTIVFAYDDIHSIEMYHKPVDAYYKLKYKSFEKMLAIASSEKEIGRLKKWTAKFDRKLMNDMKAVSDDYATIGALAYRQAVAAHKLVAVNGKVYFLSKENYSNGCLATLDVTYPSIPLFLVTNPELVKGMMRPLFDYANSEMWPYPFAPHDTGKYPYCNGQVYSTNPDGTLRDDKQMPVEESGNAILTMIAIAKAEGNDEFLMENKDILTKWANFLLKFGYDPENQLCTDDFAGHLAHNCNLSLKAICALAAYGKQFNEPSFTNAAKDMATRWVVDAKKKNGKGYRLTFTEDDTWSLKYNIIWDRLFKLGLFDEKVYKEEIEVYKEKTNKYGVPLDSRADYTKVDWILWTTVMTEDKEYLAQQLNCIKKYMEDTLVRVPMPDWYDTSVARKECFQARSVIGGYFIQLLKKKLLEQ